MGNPAKRGALAVVVVSMLGSCGKDAAGPPGSPAQLPEGRWHLVALVDRESTDYRSITINLGVTGEISGSAPCNRYFGMSRQQGGALRFGVEGTTSRTCSAPVMALESEFLAGLREVAGWHMDGALVLTDDHGRELLRFAR